MNVKVLITLVFAVLFTGCSTVSEMVAPSGDSYDEYKTASGQKKSLTAEEKARLMEHCVKPGDSDLQVLDQFVFGGGKYGKGLLSKKWRSYLIGLCIPKDVKQRYALNEYLMTLGAMHSLYAEKNLQELVDYLREAGVSVAVAGEAIENDDGLVKTLKKSNNSLDKAGKILRAEKSFTKQVNAVVSKFNKLRSNKKAEARRKAALVRESATRSTYYLSRAVYVSKRLADHLVEEGVLQYESTMNKRSNGSASQRTGDLIENVYIIRKMLSRKVRELTGFIRDDRDALSSTLINAKNIISALGRRDLRIPKVSEQALQDEVQRLNQLWSVPDEYPGEVLHVEG